MKLYENKYDCCGCTACEQICPNNAIKMLPDEEGFVYPMVDDALCIECNCCITVCSFKNTKINTKEKPITYGVKNKNNNVRMLSRSGGVFTSLSDYILDQDGSVYGVGYKEHFIVCHKKSVTYKERDEFRGSKYVQSNLSDIFKQIKNDLYEGKYVLFSGTPCQVGGLYSYLKNKNTEKLFTCDLVCHGTPSPLIWKDYISFVEKKYNGRISEFNFRNKVKFGWEDHVESFVINLKEHNSKIFTSLFYKHIILRPSCHNCKYTSIYRSSDVTLADFWGVEKNLKNFNDNKGVSLILLNSEKGERIFNHIKDKLIYEQCEIENCMQPSLCQNFNPGSEREEFWNDYMKYGFEYVLKKYLSYGIRYRLNENVKLKFKEYKYKIR